MKKLIILLIIGILFITGCEEQKVLLIKDVTKDEVVSILRDYVGLNGWEISYANEDSGIYRIHQGIIQRNEQYIIVQVNQQDQDVIVAGKAIGLYASQSIDSFVKSIKAKGYQVEITNPERGSQNSDLWGEFIKGWNQGLQ